MAHRSLTFIPHPRPSRSRHLSLVSEMGFAQRADTHQSYPNIDCRAGQGIALPGGSAVDSFDLLLAWRHWLEASYAPSTVEVYWGAVLRFLAAHPVPLVLITEARIVAWIESFPFR